MILEPVDLHQQMWGWGKREATVGEAVCAFSAGRHRKAELYPLRQTLPHITVTPQVTLSQAAQALDLPAPTALIPQQAHTFLLSSTIQGVRRQSSPERRRFLVASGISFRLPQEHFTKSKSHGRCSAVWAEATLGNTPDKFVLSWVLVGADFFPLLSLIFLKGIWGWCAETERGKCLY